MNIAEYIPEGKENAVSRTELARLTGLPDRENRKEIERIRPILLADSGVWIMAKSGARGYWLTDSLAEMRQFLNEADSRIVAIMQGTAALRIYLARAEGRETVIHVRNYDRRVRIIPSEFEQIRLEV